MTERIFGISYYFTPTPSADEVAKSREIIYNPIMVYKEGDREVREVKAVQDFRVTSRDLVTDYNTLTERKNLYTEMQKRSRAAQERIISEYICTIILTKAREYPDDRLTFLVRDEFQTEKIVGRLGYLGLPMDRLRIMFVSWNLASFMGNYIEHYAVPPTTDLTLLFSEKYQDQILGPYPDDAGVSMLRTYYCSFPGDSYPVKVNLFCQMLSKEDFDKEREHIDKIFKKENTAVFDISVGKSKVCTRLPDVLVECEEMVQWIEHEGE